MTTCRECGRKISDQAKVCPGCGAPGPAAGAGLNLGAGGPAPAGVELAEWGTRVGAYLLDAIILVIPTLLIFFVSFRLSADAQRTGASISFVPFFFLTLVVSVFYKPLMEGTKGQTLGKMAVGIKVVDVTGAKIGMGKAFLRWFIGWVINFVPFGGLLDDLWPLWDERNQTLHDKVAGTLVVRA